MAAMLCARASRSTSTAGVSRSRAFMADLLGAAQEDGPGVRPDGRRTTSDFRGPSYRDAEPSGYNDVSIALAAEVTCPSAHGFPGGRLSRPCSWRLRSPPPPPPPPPPSRP